jgi:DNA replication protein DnaC
MLIALVGGRGPGKTQMAVELMRDVTAQKKSAFYTTATEFFVRVKSSYRDDGQKAEGEILKTLRKYRLLVIDEIGKRAETQWENNLLFELINGRYNDMTDTVVIDNNEPEKFAESVGPSIASRINETGGIVHCVWPSFRQ